MYVLKRLALAASVAGMLFAAAANADEMFDDGLDDEPSCPYGYYDFAPYDCAPYGYYGSEWFADGAIASAAGLTPRWRQRTACCNGR